VKYVQVDTKENLVAHQEAIAGLFSDSFGDRSIDQTWSWAYLQNPTGEPLVTLCYEDDVLVGHYAVIPMPLVIDSHRKNSYLSMTTMVATTHRKFGLFNKLAKTTYGMAMDCGADFIMGFPNQNSIPGFRKRLNWNLPQTDFVATISKDQLVGFVRNNKVKQQDILKLDLQNEVVRNWRLNRPGVTYYWEGGSAWKIHLGQIDLIWYDDNSVLELLPNNLPINLLMHSSERQYLKHKSFDYQFGGLGMNSVFNPAEIARDMALSDLF
jgi:hypothetical protein